MLMHWLFKEAYENKLMSSYGRVISTLWKHLYKELTPIDEQKKLLIQKLSKHLLSMFYVAMIDDTINKYRKSCSSEPHCREHQDKLKGPTWSGCVMLSCFAIVK